MGKSSIHLQTAKAGTILHNARENYSKSVVFLDETNEIWNDSKTAFKLFREELEIRSNAYTQRTKQKLQKNTSTMISGVVNLEQHHTLKDMEKIKDELEKEFDTKVIQMSIHRDEGKLVNKKNEDLKLVSGKDFFLNSKDNQLYFDSKFTKKINMNEWKSEKNYHGHFEMLGIDSNGNSLRKKMNIYKLSQLQDFTAETLKMERGNNNVEVVKENGVEKVKRKTTNNKKRLDTHQFKASKKRENEVTIIAKKEIVKEANQIVEEANEIIKNKNKTIRVQNETILKQKEDKKKLKEELEELKKANNLLREEMKANQSQREDYKKQEELNRQLQEELKASKIDLSTALEKIEELKKEIFHPTIKKIDDTPATNLEVADYFENELNKKDLEIVDLKTENESLQEQNKTLENKVSTLEAKSIPTQTMSDYEAIKKENESLKKENSFLKRVVDKVINYANYKIKELINFGKPQVKKSVSLEDFIEKNTDENNHKSNSNILENLNKNLEKFVSPKNKKEDLDSSEHYSNMRER